MTAFQTKQEILNRISILLGHSGWKVSAGSTEPRIALFEIAESIGVPTGDHDSKRTIAKAIVESWGLDWYPNYESSGETITRLGLAAVLEAVTLATHRELTSNEPISSIDDSEFQNPQTSRAIQIGQMYRFQDHANANPDLEFIEGTKNWFFFTDARQPALNALRPQAGIWNPKKVKMSDRQERVPLVVCTTFPIRAGSKETPWLDKIDVEEGRVLYYGDNKDPDCIDPSFVRGNRIMLENEILHHSELREDRELAAPILILQAHGNRQTNYGFRTPVGLGVIWRSDRVNQQSNNPVATFQNFRFEIFLLDLTESDNSIDMKWIHARRDPQISSTEANKYAPKVWRDFVLKGIQDLPRLQVRTIR